jgi:hypothetical protein
MRVIRIRGAESAARAYAAASGADKSRETKARRFIDTKNVAHGSGSRDAEGPSGKRPEIGLPAGQVAARLGGTKIWVFRNCKTGFTEKTIDPDCDRAYNYDYPVLWSDFVPVEYSGEHPGLSREGETVGC